MSYIKNRDKFLARLASSKSAGYQSIPNISVRNEPKKPLTPYAKLCELSLCIMNFKSIVFELLENYGFEKCSTFPLLLQKWKKYDVQRTVPELSIFLVRTEPNINKLPFYKAAFEHLDNIHLAEFLAESIAHGELSEEILISLENAI